MRKLTRSLYILFLFGCGELHPDKAQVALSKTDTIDIFNKVIYAIDNVKDSLDLKSIEAILSKKYFTKASFRVEFKEASANKIKVYSVKLLGEDLPASLHTTYTFIDAGEQHLQYLMPIEYNQLYQVGNEIMLGGIYTHREFDYYLIYALNSNFLKIILDTRDIGGQQIRIGYYKDDECIDYVPDRFSFKHNTERNEIQFTGVANNYCLNGEDRTQNAKPVKKSTLQVIIRYHQGKWEFNKAESNYIFW